MLHHDPDGRLLLARERAELLASEMRRVRRLTPEEAGRPSWRRLAAELFGRRERIDTREGHRLPAYDA